MTISLIAAMDKNRLIGQNNKIPWRLPADLQHFRRMTLGKPVVMGRKTFESIGKPLVKRVNIIMTRDTDYAAGGCIVTHSIEETLEAVKGHEEAMIIGGASVYSQFLPYANRLYLTQIHGRFEGNVYFPEFNWDEWKEVKRIDCESDEENPYSYCFLFLYRKR